MTDTDDLLARFLTDGAFRGDKVWLHDAAGRVVLYMGIGPADPDDIDLADALRRERAEVERLQADFLVQFRAAEAAEAEVERLQAQRDAWQEKCHKAWNDVDEQTNRALSAEWKLRAVSPAPTEGP